MVNENLKGMNKKDEVGFFERKSHERRLKKQESLRLQIIKEKKLLEKQEKVTAEKKVIVEEKRQLHEIHLKRTAEKREKVKKLESNALTVGKSIGKGLRKLIASQGGK